jgi:hypothetical protein
MISKMPMAATVQSAVSVVMAALVVRRSWSTLLISFQVFWSAVICHRFGRLRPVAALID